MGIAFNAEEILEIAEQIERNGQNYYRTAARYAQDEKAKKLLTDLAEMEVTHEKTFMEMKNSLKPEERQGKDYDPAHAAAAYLHEVARGNVFDIRKDPSKNLTGEESLEKILETALGMEKESVVFYVTMKDMVPAHMGNQRITDIINEELSHIALLSRHLAELK
jgi:rubrerythrin